MLDTERQLVVGRRGLGYKSGHEAHSIKMKSTKNKTNTKAMANTRNASKNYGGNKDFTMSLRLDTDHGGRLRQICKLNGQTLSDFMRQAIVDAIEAAEIEVLEKRARRAEINAIINGTAKPEPAEV